MPGGRGLLERISSPNPRQRPAILDSILNNLISILNTQEGDGFTCPDMGCDFSNLLARWPSSEVDVLAVVRRTIERYEPRLTHVQVQRVGQNPLRVDLEISGRLKDTSIGRERVKVRTELSRAGRVKLG